MSAVSSIEAEFAAAMSAHHLHAGEIVADGKLHRFDGQDEKRGKRSAWYVLHGDDPPAGAFGDWRTGLSESWRAKSGRAMSDAELHAERQRIARAKVEAAAERIKVAQEAAAKCGELWSKAAAVLAEHSYNKRKGIKPLGARQLGDTLLIPLRDGEGKLHSLQFIQPDGSKRFKTGGAVAGCYCALGGKPGPDAPLLICEGWATACSLHEATGYPVAAAMNAGNLLAVAQAMRAKLPDATMIVCADDDNKSDGNPGLTKAREAANAIGAGLAVPDFGAERPEDATDFNDLHVMRGTNAVRACIDAAREPPENAGEPTVGDDLSFPGLNERPCWRVYEGCGNGTGRKIKPGVYWHGVKPGINDAPSVPIDKWICTPMTVTAVTRNREDAEYGRLLEILSPTGRRKKWAMPMSMLAGDGSEARAVLLSEGLVFDLHDKNAILRYIAGQSPKRVMRAASVTGWHDDAFVLPDAVIGADDIWFQASARVAPYATAGTFDGWRELAALASGNPLLMLTMSAAMAGPLLGPLNIDGGGANLFGDTSCGKTTAMHAGVSVWGGASFKRTWRATANGLEGVGSMHSDTLLALDELGEVDPRSLYEAAYALVNGTGKTRANRQVRPA